VIDRHWSLDIAVPCTETSRYVCVRGIPPALYLPRSGHAVASLVVSRGDGVMAISRTRYTVCINARAADFTRLQRILWGCRLAGHFVCSPHIAACKSPLDRRLLLLRSLMFRTSIHRLIDILPIQVGGRRAQSQIDGPTRCQACGAIAPYRAHFPTADTSKARRSRHTTRPRRQCGQHASVRRGVWDAAALYSTCLQRDALATPPMMPCRSTSPHPASPRSSHASPAADCPRTLGA